MKPLQFSFMRAYEPQPIPVTHGHVKAELHNCQLCINGESVKRDSRKECPTDDKLKETLRQLKRSKSSSKEGLNEEQNLIVSRTKLVF